jgi:FAD/FMN-containing dehydrogenase
VTTSPTHATPAGTAAAPGAASLRGLCGGAVHRPGDPGYDAARMPWNVAVDQRPAAVAYPASATEVAEVVRAATAAGLRVAAQGTGHNAGPLGSLADAVLVRTSGMTAVTVDAAARTARAEAGVLWDDVVQAVAEHGLMALHGSSPDVGVVGYSLGGGMGWYAREHGLQSNHLTAVELVTPDGELVRADAGSNPDLFWALRGGGGSFGVVTALEFRVFPIETAYAGWLVWDASAAQEVLPRWAEWSLTAPDEVTTAFRILAVPPFEEIPEPLRGRNLVVVNGAVLGGDDRAGEILAPLRALAPEIDTFARVPAASLSRLHMDPEGPTPAVSSSLLLRELPAAAVDAFLATAGHGSGSSLVAAELRQLGGALGRPHEGGGALAMVEGRFAFFSVAIAATPELAAQGLADARRVADALRPWANGRSYLNFTEEEVDTSTGYDAASFARLQQVRAAVDPHAVMVANHPVPPASPAPAPAVPRQR